MKKSLVILLLAAFSAPGYSATVLIGGSVQNGNFESSGTGTVQFSTGNIIHWTNWAEQDSANNNTGVYTNQGDRTAFIQAGGAIRNMTNYLVAVGDTFNYSFDNELAGRDSATIQLVYDNGGVITAISGSELPGTPVNTHSRSFTVQQNDPWVGKAIGVGMFTTGNFPEVDNVTLTLVPEPTIALLGGIGLLALLRRSRA